MRTIRLQEQKTNREGGWNKKLLDKNDYEHYLKGEDVTVLGPDGELLVVVKRNAVPMDILKTSWTILRKLNMTTTNRGSASGMEMKKNIKADGTASKTLRPDEAVKSGIIGYFDRYPRIPYCRECAWTANNPTLWKMLLPLFQSVSETHKKYARESWELQKKWIDKTSEDFYIPGTIYTTVTVNKNFRTAAHLDAKNLYDGMAAMLYLRQGKLTGGDVVLPEWKTGVHLDTNDLIIFRNMKDYHGNTPITPLNQNTQRCTLVFYYREGMVKCGTAEQELERAKSGSDFSKDFSEERICGECVDNPCSAEKRAECFSGGRASS